MSLLSFKIARSLAPLIFPKSRLEGRFFPPSFGMDEEQAAFFRQNGYLVKLGVIDSDLLARAVDYTLAQFPSRFDSDRPETLRGIVEDCLCKRSVRGRKGRVKFRESVRGERWLYEMVDANRCIRSTVEVLLGSSRTPPLPYVRGIYPVLPSHSNSLKRARPHTDGHQFLVGTMTYLSDVMGGGGGFHVWPGSHLEMRNHFRTEAGSGWTENYHRELYSYACRNRAVEIAAPAGAVIFWHHRLVHAAGINRTGKIRHALLADYPTTDIEKISSEPVGSDPWSQWRFETDAVGRMNRRDYRSKG